MVATVDTAKLKDLPLIPIKVGYLIGSRDPRGLSVDMTMIGANQPLLKALRSDQQCVET